MPDSLARLEQLFEAAHQRAWRLAYSLLRDAHAAFDCVQQAYLVAAKNPGRIPDGDAWPWFAVVVGFEARNLLRKKRPATNAEGVQVDKSPSESPELAAQRVDDGRLLWQALDTLPQEERQAIVLTHVNGLTHALAAQALGLPEKTVSSQVARGLERLRGKLKTREEELGSYLAVLPVAAPPGGFDAALAAWKATAMRRCTCGYRRGYSRGNGYGEILRIGGVCSASAWCRVCRRIHAEAGLAAKPRTHAAPA
jgi:RNA polymerase sigma-70 factor (ECF subfamily)